MKYNRYPKRDAVKNYFPLPNEIFGWDLSAGEIAVYAYLMYCEDRKTFQCHPSYKTIGSAVELSKNTVKKHIDRLVAKQLITTEPTPRKIHKSGTGCLYQINDNLWEGSFFQRLPSGKRKKFNVYAETREQCVIKLDEMLERAKAEIAEEKAKRKEGAD